MEKRTKIQRRSIDKTKRGTKQEKNEQEQEKRIKMKKKVKMNKNRCKKKAAMQILCKQGSMS